MTFNTPDNRRREVTLICGIIGIILGVVGVLGRIEDVLSLLAYLVCPVGGVMFALPAHEYWRTPKGISIFGPRAMGYDVDYIPL